MACEQAQTPCGACAATTYQVPAGGSLEFPWDATGLRSGVTMPASCFHDAGEATSCSQVVAAEAAEYDVQITGYDSCSGTCSCDVNGLCDGSPDGQQAASLVGKLNFPSDSAVEVVFGMCAFGCP